MDHPQTETIRRLPAGAHGIPPQLVARNQRERLIAAIAEACAEKGYAEVSVADVVRRGGVSTATFYKRFESKRDCMLAAHDELVARWLEEVEATCDGAGWEAGVRAAVARTLELFAADAPTARLLLVEILALGPEGASRHAAMIEALAARLRAGRDPRRDPGTPDADWALVAAAASLVARQTMAGEAAALPALADGLVAILAPPA